MRNDPKTNQVIFAGSTEDADDSENLWTAPYDGLNLYLKYSSVPRVTNQTDVICKNLLGTICGTDLQKLKTGNKTTQDKYIHKRPGVLYLGHETVAEVVEVGSDVKQASGIDVGDRVCIAELSTCRAFNIDPECELCLSGKPLHCLNKNRRKFDSDAFGGWSQFFKRSCWQLYKVRSSLSYPEAALLEPAATAWAALQKINNELEAQSKIAVFGTGIFGILTIRMIRMLYPKIAITVFGISIGQGEVAIDSGAQFRLLNGTISAYKEYENSFDYCIDCSGHSDIWNFAALTLKPNSCLLAIGFLTEGKSEELNALSSKEIKILTTHGYSHSNNLHAFAQIENFLIGGQLHISDLLTHIFPRNNFTDAFNLALFPSVNHAPAIRIGLQWS